MNGKITNFAPRTSQHFFQLCLHKIVEIVDISFTFPTLQIMGYVGPVSREVAILNSDPILIWTCHWWEWSWLSRSYLIITLAITSNQHLINTFWILWKIVRRSHITFFLTFHIYYTSHSTYVTSQISNVLSHISHFIFHIFYLSFHINNIIFHISYLTSYIAYIISQNSCPKSPVSYLKCHISYITPHIPFVTYRSRT